MLLFYQFSTVNFFKSNHFALYVYCRCRRSRWFSLLRKKWLLLCAIISWDGSTKRRTEDFHFRTRRPASACIMRLTGVMMRPVNSIAKLF